MHSKLNNKDQSQHDSMRICLELIITYLYSVFNQIITTYIGIHALLPPTAKWLPQFKQMANKYRI